MTTGESLRATPSLSSSLSSLTLVFVSNSQVCTFLIVHQIGWVALGLLVTSSVPKTQALASCGSAHSAHDSAVVLPYGAECSLFPLP